jgi:cytochrome o ubiquinol oxidase operon protein cyoD
MSAALVNPKLRTYVSGYVLSMALTLAAYLSVTHPAFSSTTLVVIIIGLALVQFLVQLVFFLHLGQETKPRWKLFVFIFMIMVVLIIVLGSLWIMNNLNYRMTPQQVNNYLNDQGGGF